MNNRIGRPRRHLRAALALGATLTLLAACGDGGWADYSGGDDGMFGGPLGGMLGGMLGGGGYEDGGPGFYGMGMPYYGGGDDGGDWGGDDD